MANSSDLDYTNIFKSFFGQSVKPSSFETDATVDDCIEDDEDQWKERYDNLKKDFQSYKSRVERTLEIEKTNLRRQTVRSMLEMVEFIMTVMEGKRMNERYHEEDHLLVKRIFHILQSKFNVVPMSNLVGKPFNPKFHDAVCVDDDVDESMIGKITRVYSNGYMEKDGGEEGILVHAKVCVGG